MPTTLMPSSDPGEKFISVTELGDGRQGHALHGRPDGRFVVTVQVDIWHPWRVAVDDLADYLCHRLDGRVPPGMEQITSIRAGVRSVVQEANSRMWRLSQRFTLSAYD